MSDKRYDDLVKMLQVHVGAHLPVDAMQENLLTLIGNRVAHLTGDAELKQYMAHYRQVTDSKWNDLTNPALWFLGMGPVARQFKQYIELTSCVRSTDSVTIAEMQAYFQSRFVFPLTGESEDLVKFRELLLELYHYFVAPKGANMRLQTATQAITTEHWVGRRSGYYQPQVAGLERYFVFTAKGRDGVKVSVALFMDRRAQIAVYHPGEDRWLLTNGALYLPWFTQALENEFRRFLRQHECSRKPVDVEQQLHGMAVYVHDLLLTPEGTEHRKRYLQSDEGAVVDDIVVIEIPVQDHYLTVHLDMRDASKAMMRLVTISDEAYTSVDWNEMSELGRQQSLFFCWQALGEYSNFVYTGQRGDGSDPVDIEAAKALTADLQGKFQHEPPARVQ